MSAAMSLLVRDVDGREVFPIMVVAADVVDLDLEWISDISNVSLLEPLVVLALLDELC